MDMEKTPENRDFPEWWGGEKGSVVRSAEDRRFCPKDDRRVCPVTNIFPPQACKVCLAWGFFMAAIKNVSVFGRMGKLTLAKLHIILL